MALNEEEIVNILEQSGINDNANLDLGKLKYAIAKAIVENDKNTQKENNIKSKIKWMYNK